MTNWMWLLCPVELLEMAGTETVQAGFSDKDEWNATAIQLLVLYGRSGTFFDVIIGVANTVRPKVGFCLVAEIASLR